MSKRKLFIGGAVAALLAYVYYAIGRLDDSWDYQPADWARARDGW